MIRRNTLSGQDLMTASTRNARVLQLNQSSFIRRENIWFWLLAELLIIFAKVFSMFFYEKLQQYLVVISLQPFNAKYHVRLTNQKTNFLFTNSIPNHFSLTCKGQKTQNMHYIFYLCMTVEKKQKKHQVGWISKHCIWGI